MTDLAAARERLRELAEATSEQVHPASWPYWITQVLMAGPARDFIEAASPQTVLALLGDTADVGPTHVSTPSVEPLDVGRLARALEGDEPLTLMEDRDEAPEQFSEEWFRELAVAIAAEYARLLPTQASDSPEKTT